jgi:hypothetical protein
MKVVRLSAVYTVHLYPQGNFPGSHFRYRMSRPQGQSAAEMIRSMKYSNDTNGNRTRDLPACSSLIQQTAQPHAPFSDLMHLIHARNIEHTELRYQVPQRYKEGRLQYCKQASSTLQIFVRLTQPDCQYETKHVFVLCGSRSSAPVISFSSSRAFGFPLSSNSLLSPEKIYQIAVTFHPFSSVPSNPYSLSLCIL